MRRVRLDIELFLDDEVADEVESLEDLALELATYFKAKYSGGIMLNPDKLMDIINDVLDDYDEDDVTSDSILTDNDTAKIEDIVANTISKLLGDKIYNIQPNNSVVYDNHDSVNDVIYDEESEHNNVISFDSPDNSNFIGNEDGSDDIDEDDLDDLSNMFGF